MTSDVIDSRHASFEMLAEQLLGSSLAQLAMEPEQYAQVKAAQQAQAQQVMNQVTQSAEATIISVDTTLAKLQAEIDTMGGLLDPNAPQKNSNDNTTNNSNINSHANTAIGSTSATNQGNVNVRNSNVTVNNGVNTNSQQSTSNATTNSGNSQQLSKAQQWNAQQKGQATWSTKNNNDISQPNSMSYLDQADDDSSLLEAAHVGLGLGGISIGVGKYSNVLYDEWQGLNGKWYSRYSSFFGNQYTGSRNAVIETADDFEKLGRVGLIAEIGMGAVQITNDYQQGDYIGIAKASLDVIMSSIGELGGVPGFIAYGGYKMMDLWVSAVNNTVTSINTQYEAATGENEWVSNPNIWKGPGE